MPDGDREDRPSVAVADADEAIRSLVQLTLDGDRLAVVQAGDTDELLQALAEHGPALAIVDRALPERGGIAACWQVKQQDDDVRTILLVRKEDLDDVRDEQNVVDALLTKPFTSLALLRKVDDVLGVEDEERA